MKSLDQRLSELYFESKEDSTAIVCFCVSACFFSTCYSNTPKFQRQKLKAENQKKTCPKEDLRGFNLWSYHLWASKFVGKCLSLHLLAECPHQWSWYWKLPLELLHNHPWAKKTADCVPLKDSSNLGGWEGNSGSLRKGHSSCFFSIAIVFHLVWICTLHATSEEFTSFQHVFFLQKSWREDGGTPNFPWITRETNRCFQVCLMLCFGSTPERDIFSKTQRPGELLTNLSFALWYLRYILMIHLYKYPHVRGPPAKLPGSWVSI